MEFRELNGNNIANDVKIIEGDFKQGNGVVYVFTHPTTKLYAYIEKLSDNGITDDIMFNLKICYGKRSLNLSYISENDPSNETKLNSISELVERLDFKPCSLIVNDNKRETLAEVAQQLIYINYPLTLVDIMLRNEAKDAEKTKRFMNKVNEIYSSIDSAITNIAALHEKWSGSENIPEEEKAALLKIVSDASERCIAIKEKVEKAQSVEMTIAVAASKKTGKSVIVNSMIGEELAPTSLEMATPNTCVYKKSPDDRYHLTYCGNRTSYSTADELYSVIDKEFKEASTNKENNFRIEDMVIEYTNKGNNFDTFTIFDTPGPDAAGTNHFVSAREAMSKCDVAIFCIDYSKYLTNDEEKYLNEIKTDFNSKQKFASLLFAINKLDLRYDDAKSTKSTVKSIDFIRNRLIDINGFYKDCIVFATSALQYYNTIHCEKICGEEFSAAENLNNLRAMAKHQTGSVRNELLKLDSIAGHYYVEHGFDKVSAADLKQHSGMPDLLNYAEYICKAKAREEIVNNITVTIDAQNKALKAITDRIENIDRLIENDEEQIERIKCVITEYTESVGDKLETKILHSDIEQEEETLVLLDYFKRKNNPDSLTLGDIGNMMDEKITEGIIGELDMVTELFCSIRNGTYNRLNESISQNTDSKNVIDNVVVDKILDDVFSSETIVGIISSWIREQLEVEHVVEYDTIKNLADEMTKLINSRFEFIREKSDEYREKLKKMDVNLEVPEVPEFKFELPSYKSDEDFGIKRNFQFLAPEGFKSLFIKGSINIFRQFFRNIRDKQWGRNESIVKNDMDRKEYDDAFHCIHEEICGLLREAEIYDVLRKSFGDLSESLRGIVNSIDDQFQDIMKAIDTSVGMFSKLIDDTELHKQNIEAHNREKVLIRELNSSYNDFLEIWENVLRDISNRG